MGNKYIYLELYPDGNFLCYKIKNSYAPVKNFYFNKNHYISSGYGLSIIKGIINKYGAAWLITLLYFF
ncbi:GHKL domain-containing protein [Tissierella praeacuta]|uniref:GHKL domain-containing protein n=1 Tax=Tissierella praeacuta TaxID=43131 RepID=UPI0035178D4B